MQRGKTGISPNNLTGNQKSHWEVWIIYIALTSMYGYHMYKFSI